VSRDGLIRAATESELPRLVDALAVILPLTLLIQVLADPHDYRQPAVPVAVWLGVLVVAGWLVPRARAGGLSAAQARVAIAVAVTAVTAVGWDRRVQSPAGNVDLSILGTIWLIVLVALSRPARVWVSGALLVFAVHAVFVVHVLGMSPLSQVRLATAGYVLGVILAVFAALRPTLRAHAGIAARRDALASSSAAERAAAAAVHEDRRARFALLEVEALPLLRGIADGTLDPAAAEVRDRCARYAATLRRALVDRSRDAGELLAELESALSTAQDRGLPLEVQVIGDPGSPPPAVIGATRAAVDGVVSALPPHPVTLTVLASGADVELFVIFGLPPRSMPDLAELRRRVPATAQWRAAVEVDDTGAGCLEVRWRNGTGSASEIGAILSSRRGRVSPPSPLTSDPPPND
jgi:hypothetical protein